jgi:hypothetical protein
MLLLCTSFDCAIYVYIQSHNDYTFLTSGMPFLIAKLGFYDRLGGGRRRYRLGWAITNGSYVKLGPPRASGAGAARRVNLLIVPNCGNPRP